MTEQNISTDFSRIKCLTHTQTHDWCKYNDIITAVLYILVSPATDLQIPRVSPSVLYEEYAQFLRYEDIGCYARLYIDYIYGSVYIQIPTTSIGTSSYC